MELLEIFLDLVKIPSPSLKEEKVAQKIIEILSSAGIDVKKDDYGNVLAKIAPTDGSKKSLLLSAHMDVVGDDSPIIIKENGNFIETDKTRTLGADDKAGVAAAIKLALELQENKDFAHGGLELVFTRDEEQGMTGIEHVKFNELDSEHIIVLDSDKLGKFEVAGASYTKLDVYVTTKYGGHSGLDIDKPDRLNAAKLVAEYVNVAPMGLINEDELGVVTSSNLGAIVGGGVSRALEGAQKSNEPCKYIAQNCTDNVINTSAAAHYSIRSTNAWFEQELIDVYKSIAENLNDKYKGLAKFEVEVIEHLKPFEKSDDTYLTDVAKIAAKNQEINIKVSSFHAGAETHIYANEKNSKGVVFKPVLVGIADIFDMHSPHEKIDVKSYQKGYEFLKEIFVQFNN